MDKRGGKGVYLAALVLFLGGLGYLIYTGLTQDSVYFLNVSEALAMDPAELRQARLFGRVSGQGLERRDGVLGVSFDLVDKDNGSQSIRVEYKGAVPDTFMPGAEVIVEGSFSPADRTFGASTLITKCPSKYEKMSRERKA
ncbi:MAG: cytochrome c maturation protein CcmE [Desulfovibrionaceae bacterium]|nr:cytochrome c maturation protein CcmE [Desulfovibrionaceae bacterium]